MPYPIKQTLLVPLQETAEQLANEFVNIPSNRKQLLKALAEFVESKINMGQTAYLNFICTHNSRRSHLSQIWAQAAAYHYAIDNVTCFSGGTEATAFNPRAVKAMQTAGFGISKLTDGENPVYEVHFALDTSPVKAFSKKYDDPFNHSKDFAAIMTCSHADEHCPVITGATTRIALTYDDPKEFDGTLLEAQKYLERVHEIGRDILYAFSQVRHAKL